MHADTRAKEKERAPLGGPKLRLHTLESLDGRPVASRRAYELIESFQSDLGGKLSAGEMLAVRRAAMLSALAEHEASRQMAGEASDIDHLVRITNAARRAVADLGLHKTRGKRNAGPTLAEYVAQHHAASVGASPVRDAT